MTEIKKIIINILNDKFLFSITETDGTQAEHEYAIDKKMSVAANLREVFREQSYMKAAKTTPEGIPSIHAAFIGQPNTKKYLQLSVTGYDLALRLK